MPLKSKAQQRWMFAAEDRGELEPGTAKRWAKETPNIKDLPPRVKKSEKRAAYSAGQRLAMVEAGLITKEAQGGLLEGSKVVAQAIGQKLKDFFTARKVREALSAMGEARAARPSITSGTPGELGKRLATGIEDAQMARLKEALKPYAWVGGLGTLGALTPTIGRAIYPGLED
jgi:hypothetical protein